jgi:hypothetical protein
VLDPELPLLPQLILLLLIIFNTAEHLARDGQPRPWYFAQYCILRHLFDAACLLLILWWGGFFDELIRRLS